MKGRLHITNGDQAAKAITFAGLATDVLAWRDVLHDGPVPGNLKLSDLSRVRAEFLGMTNRGVEDSLRTEFTTRDAAFGMAAGHGHITLWFESDLYDQLQLVQILNELLVAKTPLDDIELVEVDGYLGQMDAVALAVAYDSRRRLDNNHLEIGSEFWDAFRQTSPDRLIEKSSRDHAELPYMAAAFRRLFEEFPWVGTGLTRTQTSALRLIAHGGASPASVFTAISAEEQRMFLGDASFATYLQEVSQVKTPLILFNNEDRVVAPGMGGTGAEFWHRPLMITEFGKQVLAGSADHILTNGTDRWIGGMRLGHGSLWRWDPVSRTLIHFE